MSIGLKRRMDHGFVQKSLSPYLDGELGERARDRVRRHLDECAACRDKLATIEMTVQLLREVPPLAVPRSFALPLSEQPIQSRYRRWNTAYSAMRTAALAVSFALVALLSGDALISSGLLFPRGGNVLQVQEVAPAMEMPVAEREASGHAEEAAMPVPDGRGAGPEDVAKEQSEPLMGSGTEIASAQRPVAEPETDAPPPAAAAPLPATAPEGGEGAPMLASAPMEEASEMSLPDAPAVSTGARGAPEGAPGVRALPKTFAAMPPAAEASPQAEAVTAAVEPAHAVSTEPSAGEPLAAAPEPKGGGGSLTVETPTAMPTAVPPSPTKPLPAATPSPARVAARITPAAPVVEHARSLAPTDDLESVWGIWRALRLGSGVLLGLLAVLLGGLVWTNHQRKP